MRFIAHILSFGQAILRNPRVITKLFSIGAWRRLLGSREAPSSEERAAAKAHKMQGPKKVLHSQVSRTSIVQALTSIREFDVRLTVGEIESAISPFVESVYSGKVSAWMDNYAKSPGVKRPHDPQKRAKKSQKHSSTETRWQNHWQKAKRLKKEFFGPEAAADPYLWRGRLLFITKAGGIRARILFLMRVIERIQPRTVLEIGFGDGLNLIALANRFPEIEFAGLELTQSGVGLAQALKQSDRLPHYLLDFSPEPTVDEFAFKRIDFRQGDASKLPWDDGAFDLVITCVALEQMEPIRPQALNEIRRVSNGWTAMIEPFREFNAEGLRLEHVTALNYFNAKVDDLRDHGLTPVFVCEDFPQKLSLCTPIVVAQRTRQHEKIGGDRPTPVDPSCAPKVAG